MSFEAVLDADKHEDEKAYRILTAIAFLTAAAAVIFATIWPSSLLSNNQVNIFGVSSATLAFSLYIFFILIGSTFYLLALGPNLNVRKEIKLRVNSFFFFEKIAKYKENLWFQEWGIICKYTDRLNKTGIEPSGINRKQDGTLQTPPSVLMEAMYQQYVKECKLLAEKTHAKVFLMRFGNLTFLIAFISLLGLVVTLFPKNSYSQLSLFMIGVIFLLFVVALSYSKLPGIHPFIKIIFWTLVIISLIAVAIVIQIPIVQTVAIVLAIIIFFTLLPAKHIVALFKVGN